MRKLSNSTPTVINTELRPFDESFRIDANGQLEQWFYDNTSQYVPNRTVTVLTLTPVLSVYDADTDKSYTTASTQGEEDYIAFYYLQWYVNEYNGTTYQETLITSSADGAGVDYFTQGNNLIVKKNVSYAHAVTIRCVATYIDPRDAGITYSVEDSVILSCSRDATVVLPEVAIVSPSARSFNPLVDGYTTENGVEVQNTEYEFEGTVTNSPAVEHVTSSDLAEYKVDGWGTEEIESASGSCAPTLTIRYPDGSIESDARFMYRKTADGTKLDVSGNAFVTNIKGETVAWNQLIYNGNFANGLTAWTNYGTNSTVAVENGKLKIIPGANNQGATYYYNFNTPLGHKMYYDFKVSSPTTGTLLLYKNSNNISGYPLIVGEKRIQSILTVGSGYAGKHINLLFRFPTAGETYYLYDVMAFDLTLIYGSGNEPTTAAAFEADYLKWFGKPLTYETYDNGSLKPVKMLSMKTVGFNLMNYETDYVASGNYEITDGGWRIRKIQMRPNTTYRISKAVTSTYDDVYRLTLNNSLPITGTGSFTTRTTDAKTATYTTGEEGYLYIGYWNSSAAGNKENEIARLREMKLSITLDVDNVRSGYYEPYWSNKAMLNVTEIKGRVVTNGEPTGNLVTIFPNGMKRAMNVYDEIYVENGKIYAIKRVNSVDMGTLTWQYSAPSDHIFRDNTGNHITDIKRPDTSLVTGNYAISGRYMQKAYNPIQASDDGYFAIAPTASANKPFVIIDHNYSTIEAFKAALSGMYFYYEIANPVIYEIDEIQSPFIFKWFGINSNGQEVDATTMPWYKEGQDTSKLKVDAMYGENINVVLRCTKGAGLNELSPSKAFASLSWRVPEIDCHVISYNGGAVRVGDDNDELAMRFGTTINVRGQVLSEARRNAHLRLNWKYRHSNSPEENDAGWDNEIEIPNNNLIHVRGTGGGTLASTLVYPYVYLLGPWKPATSTTTPYTKPTTTKDGASYERTID